LGQLAPDVKQYVDGINDCYPVLVAEWHEAVNATQRRLFSVIRENWGSRYFGYSKVIDNKLAP
jgi:hypothetical protein